MRMPGIPALWRRGGFLLASLVVAAATLAGSPSLAGSVHVWRVGTYRGIPGQFRTIQAAVDAARPGDWILVAPGDYHENGSIDPDLPAGVLIRTPGIHLRGLDRNSVIVDGTRAGAPTPCSSDPAFQVTGRNGVEVYKVSGTYVENLTVCNFLTDPATGEHGNQIWWNGGDGSGQIGMHTYWGNYLTASSGYSNSAAHPRGEYGIFVSTADGPGSINPDVPGSGLGLSGSAPVGTGVVLAGTEYITLYNNRIERNGAWGILVADLPDQETPPPAADCQGGLFYDPTTETCYYQAFGNYVWNNQFSNNGSFGNPTNGDIGLATTLHDPGNCFNGNTDPAGLTTDPPNLQSPPYNPCGSANAGDEGPLAAEALCATQLLAPCPTLPGASYPSSDATFTLPAIPAQPGMANPCAGVPRNPWCP